MPTIKHADLAVNTDRPEDRATVIVSCDVEFTDVEVNAMNVLGLRYRLDCRVLNKHLLDEDPVVTFHHHSYPRHASQGRTYEHAVFDTNVSMAIMNEHLFAKDTLVAELTLKNEETGEQVVERTEEIKIDLAA
jgi:hypothetical protein